MSICILCTVPGDAIFVCVSNTREEEAVAVALATPPQPALEAIPSL